jgi:hypothetical protein
VGGVGVVRMRWARGRPLFSVGYGRTGSRIPASVVSSSRPLRSRAAWVGLSAHEVGDGQGRGAAEEMDRIMGSGQWAR